MKLNSETKILVVDDEPGIRMAVATKLRMAGFAVDEASDGIEALEHLAENSADLVVADVGMPRMDGYTLCQRLHEEEGMRDVPVVILTAQDMEVPEQVLTKIGRHEFMMKPFSPRDLLRVVTALLGAETGSR